MDWRTFLKCMSDFEFESLEREVYQEKQNRLAGQMINAEKPNEHEISLIENGSYVQAVKEYRIRTGYDLAKCNAFLKQFRPQRMI